MLASLVGDAMTYRLGIIGKVLLLLAGLTVVLDLIGAKRIKESRRNAARRRLRSRRDLRRLTDVGPVEALSRRMVRLAVRKSDEARRPAAGLRKANGEPTEDIERLAADECLRGLTPDDRTGLIWDSYAALRASADSCQPGTVSLTELEALARELLIADRRVPERMRLDLKSIDTLLKERWQRLWTVGSVLFLLACLAVVVALCVSGERNPVLFGGTVIGVGGIAVAMWALLVHPPVMLRLQRTGSTLQRDLAHAALRLFGRQGTGEPIRWAAPTAFLLGSLLDLAASLR